MALKKKKRNATDNRLKMEHDYKLELIGKMIYYDHKACSMAQEFLGSESLSTQNKRWLKLRELVACSWDEYAEHVKQSKGDWKEMCDLINVYLIRDHLNIDIPFGTPYNYK